MLSSLSSLSHPSGDWFRSILSVFLSKFCLFVSLCSLIMCFTSCNACIMVSDFCDHPSRTLRSFSSLCIRDCISSVVATERIERTVSFILSKAPSSSDELSIYHQRLSLSMSGRFISTSGSCMSSSTLLSVSWTFANQTAPLKASVSTSVLILSAIPCTASKA